MQKNKLIAGSWLSIFMLASFSPMVLAASAPITTLAPASVSCNAGSGTDYQVGPGKQYTSIGQVPLEDLQAGDTVRIFWRAESYKEKIMISAMGTASQPVVICGVPGPSGQLPVIDGQNATTRPQLEFPFNGDGTDGGHQPRGLITIGHAHDDQTYSNEPTYVTVQGLEIRNAAQPYTFTDRAGDVRPYSRNAAGIFIQRGKNITIRGNIITDNGNGVFGGTGGGEELMENVLFEGNYIYANGNPSSDREHNVYLDGSNITYQFNRFGAPKSGSLQGSNIKERSAGVTIRYNWIEDGAHMLDLVHAQEAASSTVSMPSYNTTEVYGNIFVRSQHNGSMIHYGGDDPGATEDFRKGTLKFYNNTFVINNGNVQAYANPSVFEISTNDEKLDARNNIFYLSTVPTETKEVYLLGKRDNVTAGVATFLNNWFSNGFTPHQPQGQYNNVVATYSGYPSSLMGTNPGFIDVAAGNYGLQSEAVVQGAGQAVPLAISHQYVKHQAAKTRADSGGTTLGALTDSSSSNPPAPIDNPPVISAVNNVATPTTDTTPNYTFNSNEAGSITYGGGCISSTTQAVVGNNTITFNALAVGTYANCTIRVTDAGGNSSNTLGVASFVIESVENPSSGGGSGSSNNEEEEEGEEETPAGCSKFVDVNSNDPNYAAYQYVKSIGAMTGNPDCTFAPRGLLQRDQAAKIILEMTGVYKSSVDYCKGLKPFPDVSSSAWSYQYVCLAKNRNVITGYASGADVGKFVPGRALNRAEALAIVLRNLENETMPKTSSISYTDVIPGQWYGGYAKYAQDKGLFLGTKLYPADAMTRGEFAVMLYKLHQLGKI